MLEGCVPWPEELVRLYRERGYWEDRTLGEHFDSWVEQYADRTAIAYEGKEITYRQMGENVTRLAYHMARMGIKTHDRVIIQLLNGPDVLYLVYACVKIGAIPLCSLPTHRWAEISYFAELTGARAHAIPAGTVMGFDFEEFADELREKIPTMQFVLTEGKPKRANMFSIGDLMNKHVDLPTARKEIATYRPDPMDPALFQLSGGTTGVPKIIPRTHNDYAYNANCTAAAGSFDENVRMLTPLPMSHNFAMICMILPTHLKGGTVVPTVPKVEAMIQAIAHHKTNFLPVGGGFANLLMEVPEEERKKYDLSSFKRALCAGVVPQDLEQLKSVFGCEITQCFGMSEGLICLTRSSDSMETILNTQGRPVSEADEIKILDQNTGKELPVGKVGEMVCRGPYTIRGYYKASERNQEAFTHDGYYRSGDLARLDEHGNMIWSGRIKDCIDRGGEKVNAEEVEAHIAEFSKVKEVAVVAMPDKTMGERICAFVVPQMDIRFSLDELTDFLLNKRKIAKFKAPERLEFIDKLPITETGKFNKKALRERIELVLKNEGKIEI